MSASQANASPQGNQRVDEAPVVSTKAKMNHSRYCVDLLQNLGWTRCLKARADRGKLYLMRMRHLHPPSMIFQMRFTSPRLPQGFLRNATPSLLFARRARAPTTTSQPTNNPIYVVVFGYPLDKYSVTVEYFKSLGESTDADPNADIINCFRIGYYDAGDAMRAVRKNGEVLGGSWMIGAKWADPAQAEALLGQPVSRAAYPSQATDLPSSSNAMAVDETPIPKRIAYGHHSNGGNANQACPIDFCV
ncbi:hypothetical protein VNI00_000193 [Paramarasmius palmivorus]|uniref:RRM Nup35-type domain-containing protein n=1 Tax=Paramarasmius palmivorus TaxID=297713 RepID=A0AAW0ECP1_9AGAR